MTLIDDYRTCRTLVRAEDRDRYLSALFVPAEKQLHLFALYAFNIEIARIAEQVREPMAGEIRLQWWRDALEGKGEGDIDRSPVAHALRDTVARCELPLALLVALIDAHAFDLYGEPMQSLAQLELYLDSTSVLLMQIAAKILTNEDANGMATSAGRAFGITGLLRSFALHAARGRIYLPPLDLLARHGADPADALSGEATPSLRAALREMRDLARFHFAEAQKRLRTGDKNVLPAFLPAALVPAYLNCMERPDYDPFRTRIELPPWKKPWLLWRAVRR